MKVLRSTLSAATAGLLLLPVIGTAASAAAATNDTAATATAVTSLPTTITEDTTGATTDAQDAALNANCGAPATNASVWFKYTAPADGGVVADMSASSYSGGFFVTEGVPTGDGSNLVTCGPTTVGFGTVAGQTYYVAAFSDTATNGGQLVVTFDAVQPPATTITVDPKGTAYKDGSVKLTGTYSCTNADDFSSDIEGTITQRVGRVKITGDFVVYPLQCDGAVHPWEAVALSNNGLFRGGKSATVAFSVACGAFDCAVGYAEQTVKLNGSKK